MIATRDAINRASKHPWLWALVLLLVAILLVFVALHGVDHALEGGDVLLCIAVASFAVVLAARDRVQRNPARVSIGRGPPRVITRVVAVGPPAFHSPPLRL